MHHNFLFDLDQTLLDFHASEYKALGIVLTRNGLSFSDEIYRAFKAYNKALWLELEKGTITRTELFMKRFRDVFSRCGGDASGLDPLEVNDEFIRTMSVNGVLMDGALDFVKKVKEGIPRARIYIASNGATVNAKGRIASTGLDRYIDGLFISEDMGVTKPAAEFFEICLERIGEPGASCIMIGDSLSSDMLGAKNASLDSVWFMPSGDIEKAMKEYSIDWCAASFDELYGILEKWSETTGVKTKMDFSAMDAKKMDEYAAKAKETWGETPAYQEYEQKAKGRSQAEAAEISRQMMDIFAEFGAVRNGDPASPEARDLVKKLQAFITAHYYTCTDRILAGLGQMYAAGGEMTENIDRAGGEGTAVFASRAVAVFCGK